MTDVVLDTNVIVAGVASPDGPPGQLLRHWERGAFRLLLSEPIYAEVARALTRPYFRRRLTPGQIASVLVSLNEQAMRVSLVSHVHGAASHPEDDLVLATALDGHADALITGDKDLLALGHFRGIAILDPRAFLDRLALEHP